MFSCATSTRALGRAVTWRLGRAQVSGGVLGFVGLSVVGLLEGPGLLDESLILC